MLILSVLASCSPPEDEVTEPETDFCASIHRNDSISLAGELEEFGELIEDKTGVYVLEDGGGSLVLRAWLTEYAEKTIDVQYFIFSTDNVGLIACDYLVRAADRGVKVRILVDDIMVEADEEDILIMDSHENIEIRIYNPGVNLGKNIFEKVKKLTTDFRSANQRMHNKTFTVDGQISITGGRNVADEYFDYDHEYNFRDRDVLLLGQATGTINRSFNEFWDSEYSVPVSELIEITSPSFSDPARFDRLHQYACNPENFWPQIRDRIANLTDEFNIVKNSGGLLWLDSVYFVTDEPGKNEEEAGLGGGGATTDALLELVQNARHSIDIQSPYLVTTDLSRNLFSAATQRGVSIRILTNSLASTDNMEAFSGYQRDREELLATGVRVFEFKPDAKVRYEVMTGELQRTLDYAPIFGLHAKSMVIDGRVTVIGTFNLDPRSANLNTECLVVIHSEEVAQKVLQGMEVEFQPDNSWETTPDFNPDAYAGTSKRISTWTRKVVPRDIL